MDSVNVAARRCLREALRVVDKEGSRAGPEAAIHGAVACAGAARASGEIRDIRARSGRDGARGLDDERSDPSALRERVAVLALLGLDVPAPGGMVEGPFALAALLLDSEDAVAIAFLGIAERVQVPDGCVAAAALRGAEPS